MSQKQELIDRWSGFLTKVDGRMDEILQQAEVGTAQMITQLEYDTISVGNAWTGIKSQMFSLQEKISDTWDEKMDDMFSDLDDVSGDERMQQYYKGTDIKHLMAARYEAAEKKARADAGRKVLSNVLEHVDMNKMHHCKQCGDKMNINIYSFMAKNIKCQSCGTVNSYEPDARIQALEPYALVALADEKVVHLVQKEEDIAYEIYKLDIREDRPAIEKLREELITARKERWNIYYNFMMENVPDKAEYYERQRDERLKWAEDVSQY